MIERLVLPRLYQGDNLRGTFFSLLAWTLTQRALGRGAGREIMESNMSSLPSMLTPKNFLAVAAICFDRSDLACICFSGRFWYKAVIERLELPHLLPGRQLIGGEIECVARK